MEGQPIGGKISHCSVCKGQAAGFFFFFFRYLQDIIYYLRSREVLHTAIWVLYVSGTQGAGGEKLAPLSVFFRSGCLLSLTDC